MSNTGSEFRHQSNPFRRKPQFLDPMILAVLSERRRLGQYRITDNTYHPTVLHPVLFRRGKMSDVQFQNEISIEHDRGSWGLRPIPY